VKWIAVIAVAACALIGSLCATAARQHDPRSDSDAPEARWQAGKRSGFDAGESCKGSVYRRCARRLHPLDPLQRRNTGVAAPEVGRREVARLHL